MAIQNLDDRLRALPVEKFQKIKNLREQWLDLIGKAARLNSATFRRQHDTVLSAIDKIEAERLMVEAERLNQEILELLS
jgi:hypothetical protein